MSKKMKIWGVRYIMWGMGSSEIRWFYSKEEAEEFYNRTDFREKPFYLTYDENKAKKLIARSEENWNYRINGENL